ncbi:hypothetical protein DICVIV_07705 [Dictyocaulus viviparus]|uniref:Uncharacterized protein n=1 Tax=Dictyocaulus viviparus TaxID=29172 RepID=A0A0D8XV39_DICVI|nr:hypothetical protein DICVIV_07705 [Dictyocaulus viviparus]
MKLNAVSSHIIICGPRIKSAVISVSSALENVWYYWKGNDVFSKLPYQASCSDEMTTTPTFSERQTSEDASATCSPQLDNVLLNESPPLQDLLSFYLKKLLAKNYREDLAVILNLCFSYSGDQHERLGGNSQTVLILVYNAYWFRNRLFLAHRFNQKVIFERLGSSFLNHLYWKRQIIR